MELQMFKRASVGVLLAATAYGAWAAPITFTFNPSGSSPSLNASAGPFTADRAVVGNFSSIDILSNNPGVNNFTEQGFLPVTAFTLGGTSVGTPVNQAGGYGLYISFTATGSQNGPLPTMIGQTTTGSFSSLTYSLIGVPGQPANFVINPNGTVSVVNNPGAFVLATGSLVNPGGNSLTLTAAGLLPAAQVAANFNPNPSQSGFFVNPSASMQLLLDAAFTNTSSVISTQALAGGGTRVTINGGGGNTTLSAIPEPSTYAMLLAGLGVMGFMMRRRVGAARH